MMQTTGDRVAGGKTPATGGDGVATTSAKPMRVYEMAKELAIANKDLVAKIRALGIEVKNHMSSLDPDDVTRVRRALDKERQENTVTERIGPTVIRRRNKAAPPVAPRPAAAKAPPLVDQASPLEAPPEEELAEPMAAAEPDEEVVFEEPTAPVAEPVEPVSAAPADGDSPRGAEPAPSEQPEPAPEVEPEVPAAPFVAAAEETVAEPTAPAPVAEPTPEVAEPVAAAPEETAARDAAEAGELIEAMPEDASAEASSPTFGAKPKTQFEIELERAREATAARQAAAAAARAAAVTTDRPASPGRPAVGSIIELPLPRIQITERGPGGRPIAGPGSTGRAPAPTGADRGKWAEAQRGGGRKPDMTPFGKKRAQAGKKQRSTMITTPAEHKRVIKMEETIAVSELARQMGIKATEVLKKLWSMGMVGVNINQSIDDDTASLLAGEFGYEVQNVAFQETAVLAESADQPEDLAPRAPVVTVMGHVDHGKTSLLDAIRHTDVAAGEAGGITQHIGAYRVSTAGIGDVVFLDTPGHEAFTAMRARGAHATDIVVLVVAADDGVMPQTVEALNHAKDAKVPVVVAVNKIDKAQANPDRVRTQLSEQGLVPEDWGGDTMFVNVSAYSKEGIDKLLEALQLQADLLELKANPKKLAKGVIVEAKLDRNRGPMATVLIQEGTLKVGDLVVTGEHLGKVRALLNDKGSPVSEAGPSTPVELLGLDGVPEAGDVMNAIADEKAAKTVIEHRRDSRRKKEQAQPGRVSLENILERIQEGQVKELKIVLKTDVQGSAEALREALGRLSTEAVRVNVIQAGVGGITESDVNLAKAGGAIIIGFRVRPAGKTAQLAEQEAVDVKLYEIIYDAIDDVKKAMVGLLAPVRRERAMGKVEIRQVYTIPKVGTVAGCFVTEGRVVRSALVRLVRDSVIVHAGRLGSLKRFKDDVREVAQGYECGLTLEGYNDVKIGDVLEAYEIVEEAATL